MRRARPANDAGIALIAVMVLGAVAMYAAASLIGHIAYAISRALMDTKVVFPAAGTAHPPIAAEWPARRDIRAFSCNGVAAEGDPCPGSQTDLDDASSFTHLVRMEPM